MSYRDLRNFTEMLRTLGYPHLLSMESFRRPNFPLVAELLVWLAKRLDPEADIPTACNTEEERITLIRISAQFMALKANIRLNTKRLYQADGYAVKELLKIATILYDALKNIDLKSILENEDDGYFSLKEFDISDKVNDLKQARQLSSEITANGAALFDLLGKEVDLKALRQISVGRQFELNEVEIGVKKAIETIKNQIEETKELINNISTTEANLDSKIERRRVELDRYEKRLQTLKKVKPAFLEDFNKAEQELDQLYQQYVVRYRCQMYLEQRFQDAERIETERMRQQIIATRKLVEKLREEELLPDDEEEEDETKNKEDYTKPERPKATKDGKGRGSRVSRSKTVLDSSGSISDTESDSEDDLLDAEEPELLGATGGTGELDSEDDEDDSIAVEISAVDRRAPTAHGRRTQHTVRKDDSDDDF